MALAIHAWRCSARCAWQALPPVHTRNDAARRCWLAAAPGMTGVRSLAAGSGAAPSVAVSLVKELRGRTGASMGKCRQALAEEDQDLDKAVDWLRKRGIRSMERRTNEAAESLLAICTDGGAGSIIELSAESDFVTQNSLFQHLAISLASTAAGSTSVREGAALQEAPLTSCPSDLGAKLSAGVLVEGALLELGSVLGERLVLGQSHALVATGGVVAGYAHPKHAGALPGTGKMAALISLRPLPAGTEVAADLARVAAQLARHIVAMQPRFVSSKSVPPEVLERERTTMKEAYMRELDEKRKASLREDVLAKVLDGKTHKFYQDSVLLQQEFTAPRASAAGEADLKPVSVEKFLQEEAKSMGLEGIDVEDFRLVCL